MRRLRTERPARGFTLVEVLVALVIVAVGMAAVLGALSSAADSVTYFRDKTFAQWIAFNRISDVRLRRERLSPGKTTGEAEFAGRKWRWEQEVLELEIPGVLRMDVKVQSADAPDKKSWLATSTGVVGDAVTPPNGATPETDLNPNPRGGPGGDPETGNPSDPDDPPPTAPPDTPNPNPEPEPE